MHQDKSYYSLAKAAALAKCEPADLLHQAVQKRILLLTGVPDWVGLQTYDQSTNLVASPFLMVPQLLALAQNHCLQIELHGKTEQSDFPAGYFIESSGQLKKLLPSYGRPELNHRWAFWRTYRQELVCLLELTPDRLFVLHDDLMQILVPERASDSVDVPTQKPSTAEKNAAAPIPTETPEVESGETVDGDAAAPKQSMSEFMRSARKKRDHCARKQDQPDPSQSAKPSQSEATIKEPLQKEAKLKSPSSASPVDEAKVKVGSDKRDTTILRLKQVIAKTGLSRSTIYDKLNSKSPRYDPMFPVQIPLGQDSVGWVESEVQSWLELRIGSARNMKT